MPNTIAHLGLHLVGTRAAMPRADAKWIWLGCVVPDLPWILQRAVRAAAPEISAYDLRLYAMAQSSLFLCLVLSAAFACFAARPGRVFAILSLGAVLHLVADAAQTKWANGVHLFAPLSWELLNFGLFWPEDWPTGALTALGLAAAVYALARLPKSADDLVAPRPPRMALAGALVACYLASPFAFLGAIERSDSHYVATLRAVEQRPGLPVAFDRARVDGDAIRVWTGERLSVGGVEPPEAGSVSIRGRFVDEATIEASAAHAHPPGLRDGASYLGLAFVGLWWGICLARLRGRLRS